MQVIFSFHDVFEIVKYCTQDVKDSSTVVQKSSYKEAMREGLQGSLLDPSMCGLCKF